jgi:ribosomal protein S18 acetylase RimI-like enzyme
MPTTIRHATPDDAPALSRFASRTFRDTFAGQNTPEDMRAYLSAAFSHTRQLSEINDPAMVTLIAEEGAELIGYAQLRVSAPPSCVPEAQAIELVRLYVDRARHGRGVAHTLMQAVLEAAAARGGAIWLGVWEHNPRAIAFYQKWGFADVGSHTFQLGDDPQVDRLMWRVAGRESVLEEPETSS